MFRDKKALDDMKNIRLINFYLDKKFLMKTLNANFEFQNIKEYADIILKEAKSFYKLEEIKMISMQELEEDKNLNYFFKELLDTAIAEFLSSPSAKIRLYKELNIELHTQDLLYTHKLYVFLPKDKINLKDQRTLIYAKIPSFRLKDEHDSLMAWMHMIIMFGMFTQQR
jgi:hypothetical protein